MIGSRLRSLLHRAAVRVCAGDMAVVALPSNEEALEDRDEAIEDVREGNPRAKTRWIARASDGGLATGLWECTAGTFGWYFSCDEVVHVLDGEAEVEYQGKRLQLRPGTVAYFPIGAETVWRVPRAIRKVFVHRSPAALVDRLLKA